MADRMYGLTMGGFAGGLAALGLPLAGALGVDIAAQARPVLAMPSSSRLAAWPHAISAAGRTWVTTHSYWPWTAWERTAHDPMLALILGGVAVLIGSVVGIRAARESRSFSKFGGPHATGKGEHGTAYWRPRQGPHGLTAPKGYQIWMPPKALLHKRKKLQALPPPSDQVLGANTEGPQPYHSVVAEHIAGEYYAEQHRQQAADQPCGLVIGLTGHRPEQGAYVVSGDEHSLVFGLTGAGKSRRLYLPTIGVIGLARRESLIISDIKGELYQHTAAWLQRQGYQIRRIDLRQHPSAGSDHFNPLRPIQAAIEQGDWSVATSTARSVAQMLVGGSKNQPKDPFWERAEVGLIVAMILAHAEYAAPEQCHLYSVYTALALPPKTIDAWFQHPDRYFPGHPAVLAYSAVHSAGDAKETIGGIFAGAQGALELFALNEIAAMTAEQDGDLADSGRALTATFLVVPWHDDSRNAMVGLYLAGAIRALAQFAEDNRERPGKLPVPVHFLLDEFGNFPAIPSFSTIITTARSAGIRFTMAIQQIQQLKEKYEQAYETIISNARTWIYLACHDETTAEMISKMCGDYTLEQAGRTNPLSAGFWSSGSATPASASENIQLQGRRLLTMDEVLRWPLNESLILQAGFAPARLPLPDLSTWKAIFPEIQQPLADPDPAPSRAFPAIWPLAQALREAETHQAFTAGPTAPPPKPSTPSSGKPGLFHA